jgi:hypothetical protein
MPIKRRGDHIRATVLLIEAISTLTCSFRPLIAELRTLITPIGKLNARLSDLIRATVSLIAVYRGLIADPRTLIARHGLLIELPSALIGVPRSLIARPGAPVHLKWTLLPSCGAGHADLKVCTTADAIRA